MPRFVILFGGEWVRRERVFGRTRVLALISIILVAALPSALSVRAQSSQDNDYLQDRLANDAELNEARSDLEAAAEEQDGLTDQLGTLELSSEEIAAAIDRLELEILRQKERIEQLRDEQAAAAEELAAAETALVEAEDELARRREILSDRLVSMYVYLEAQGDHLPFEVETAAELEGRRVLMSMIGEHDKALVENLDRAAAAARSAREALEEAYDQHGRIVAQAESELGVLRDKEERQRQLSEELDRRIEEMHSEIAEIEAAQAEVEAIIAQRRQTIELEAAERNRLRAICFANPRSPLDVDGSWVDCDSVGVSIPPMAFRWPIEGRVTSEYGPRWGRIHQGIDLAGFTGDPIAAAEGGRVDFAGWIGGYGNTVILSHGGGASTLYGHMNGFAVSAGSTVKIGQTIGYVGNTGRSFGPHLHFEIRFDSRPVNPRDYLP